MREWAWIFSLHVDFRCELFWMVGEREVMQLYGDYLQVFPVMTFDYIRHFMGETHFLQNTADLIGNKVSRHLNTYKSKHTCFLFSAEITPVFRKHIL